MTIRALVIDDEEKSREGLVEVLSAFCLDVKVEGSAGTIKDGLEKIIKFEPHVVFLDIEMSDGTIFDMLSHLPSTDINIIFVTAYPAYAIKAIQFSPHDYLLKPVLVDELKASISRLKEKLLNKRQVKRFTLPTRNGSILVDPKSITYCEADGSYTHFHLTNRERLTASKPLAYYERFLESAGFFRIHNTYMVNLAEVSEYIRGDRHYVKMKTLCELPVARSRKDAFLAILSL